MDRLVRNGPAPSGGVSRHHAFPALSVPEDRILGETADKSAFQRIGFGADGRKGGRPAGADATETLESRIRAAAKQAYEDGFVDGRKAGGEDARKDMEAALNQLRRTYIEMEKFRKEIYLNAEAVTVELAMAIARKLVHLEIRTNPEIVVAVVRDALTRVVDQERIRIHVNPSDLATVSGALDAFAGLVKTMDAVVFEPDPAISPGGCQIQTQFGEIDAGIGSQLAMIEERLGAEFERRPAGR